MNARTIAPPPAAHRCVQHLPSTTLRWKDGVGPWPVFGVGPDHEQAPADRPEPVLESDAPVGTLAQCSVCGRWWVVRQSPDRVGRYSVTFGQPTWYPVRWRDLADRRRIRKATR